VDYSSAQNDFGGVNNAPNYANKTAFATIKGDGSTASRCVCTSRIYSTPHRN
jgi:hypothetical protein